MKKFHFQQLIFLSVTDHVFEKRGIPTRMLESFCSQSVRCGSKLSFRRMSEIKMDIRVLTRIKKPQIKNQIDIFFDIRYLRIQLMQS